MQAVAREGRISKRTGLTMNKRICSLVALLMSVTALLECPAARADKEAPPYSYRTYSLDGKYVFVMISPLPLHEDMGSWIETKAAEIQAIRQMYCQSGLYRNDGSTKPLWTVDWYAFRVTVASDGISLVRHGRWASSTDEEACSFFANGKLLRSYEIRDLVDAPFLLEHTVSHFEWRNDDQFDDGNLEYKVWTKDGNWYVFDLRTGNIQSQSRPVRIAMWIVAAIFAAVVVGAVVWPIIKWRRGKVDITTPRQG